MATTTTSTTSSSSSTNRTSVVTNDDTTSFTTTEKDSVSSPRITQSSLPRKYSSNGGMVGNLVVGMLGLSLGSSSMTRKWLEKMEEELPPPDTKDDTLVTPSTVSTVTLGTENVISKEDNSSGSDEDDVTTLLNNRDDITPLIQALERSRRRKKVLSHDVKRYVNHISNIKGELGKMQEKLIGSEASVRMLHRKANSLEHEVTALRDREEAALTAVAKLHSQSGSLDDEHSSATRTLAEEIQYLRNCITNGQDQIIKLTTECEESRKQISTLKMDYNTRIEKLQTENNDLLKTNTELQEQTNVLQQQSIVLHQNIDRLEPQLQEIRNQLAETERQAEKERNRLEEQLQTLGNALDTNKRQYEIDEESLQTQVQQITGILTEERKLMELDRTKIEQSLTQLQEKHSAMVQTMTTEKENLQNDIQALQIKYERTVAANNKEREEFKETIQRAEVNHANELSQLKDTHKALLQEVRMDFQKQQEKHALILQTVAEDAKSKLSIASTRQKDYEEQWYRAEERADELANRLTVVTNENELYGQEIQRLTEELNRSKENENDLTITLTREKDRSINSAVQTVTSTWTTKLEAQKEETQIYRIKCTNLQTELYDTNNQLVQEKNARTTAEFSANNLRTRLTFEQEKVKELEKLLQGLREENMNLQTMDQNNRYIHETSAAVLQQEVQTLNEKLVRVQEEYQTYKDETIVLRQRCIALTAEVKEEKTNRTSLSIEISHVTRELQQQKDRIPQLLNESTVYRKERDTLLTDLQRSREENTLLREQLAQLSSEVSKAKVEALNGPTIAAHTISTLRKALHDMSEQCDSAQKAMETLRAQNDELQTALNYSERSTHEAMLIALRNEGGLLEESLEGQLDQIDPEISPLNLMRSPSKNNSGIHTVHSLRSSSIVQGTPRLTPAKTLRSPSPTIMVSSSTKASRLQALLSEQNRTIIQITKEKDALLRKLAIAETELNVYRQIDVYSATLRTTVEASLAARDEFEG